MIVPLDEPLLVEIWLDSENIFGNTTKTTAAAMIRTIKIPTMILTGTFPVPRDDGGEGTIGCLIGSCPTDAEGWRDGAGISGLTGVPQLSQNFILSDIGAPQIVQNFCCKHHTFLKRYKKGGLHLHHLYAIINPW